jgi:hypothetical protein
LERGKKKGKSIEKKKKVDDDQKQKKTCLFQVLQIDFPFLVFFQFRNGCVVVRTSLVCSSQQVLLFVTVNGKKKKKESSNLRIGNHNVQKIVHSVQHFLTEFKVLKKKGNQKKEETGECQKKKKITTTIWYLCLMSSSMKLPITMKLAPVRKTKKFEQKNEKKKKVQPASG